MSPRRRLIPRRWYGPRRRSSALDEVKRSREPELPKRVTLPPMTDEHGVELPKFHPPRDVALDRITGEAACRRCGATLSEHGPDDECPT